MEFSLVLGACAEELEMLCIKYTTKLYKANIAWNSVFTCDQTFITFAMAFKFAAH
jgi:hypothetical protein